MKAVFEKAFATKSKELQRCMVMFAYHDRVATKGNLGRVNATMLLTREEASAALKFMTELYAQSKANM